MTTDHQRQTDRQTDGQTYKQTGGRHAVDGVATAHGKGQNPLHQFPRRFSVANP